LLSALLLRCSDLVLLLLSFLLSGLFLLLSSLLSGCLVELEFFFEPNSFLVFCCSCRSCHILRCIVWWVP
jgi:hypothetical protein